MYKRQPTLNQMDLRMIREFQKRPILYNKSDQFFKNKYLTDRAWEEIAATVGFDVNRVHDRVNQLRNRYNLEKRKVDLSRRDGLLDARSTWPLFDSLKFLDGHIRPRKSYKAMGRRPRPVGRPRKHNIPDDDFVIYHRLNEPNPYPIPPGFLHPDHKVLQMPNGTIRIKTEPDSQRPSEMETSGGYDSDTNENDQHHSDQKSVSDGEQFINPASFLVENEDSLTEATEKGTSNGADAIGENSKGDLRPSTRSALSVRSINALQNQEPSMTNGHSSRNYMANSSIALDSDSDADASVSHKQKRTDDKNPSSAKYKAFGNFVSTSLIDLPETNALELVEKFTSDIVKALLAAKKPKPEES